MASAWERYEILKNIDDNILEILSETEQIRSISLNELEEINNKYIYKQGEDLKTYLSNKENKNLIIDTGGRDAKEMRIALINSEIVVIPTTPSQFDLSVLDIMIDRVKMAKEINEKLQVIIVINRVNPNPFLTKKIDDIKTYIKELECDYIKLTNTIIYERERYKNSISNGQSVIEADTQDKAYQEIQNLSLEIFK